MTEIYSSEEEIQEFPLWETMKNNRKCFSFTLELTARCNNDCSHCYINLPAGDMETKKRELTYKQIMDIADQAVNLGALWCGITGGEPLIRSDFPEIYLGLKRKGLLVTVMTNATLINEEHIALFRRYPPRDIEVTVYGATKETYEAVTRSPGSYDAFKRGLSSLQNAGINVRLKAMAIRSNLHEMNKIADFSRSFTKDYYRFDPQLHMRLDHNQERNEGIKKERLTPDEIVILEQSDNQRRDALIGCERLINHSSCNYTCNHLFHCGAGNGEFVVNPEGMFRLCMSLTHQGYQYDLKTGSVTDAWEHFIPKIRDIRSDRDEYRSTCHICSVRNLCLWCPAHADLETGMLDSHVDYFCQVAHARARMLGYIGNPRHTDPGN